MNVKEKTCTIVRGQIAKEKVLHQSRASRTVSFLGTKYETVLYWCWTTTPTSHTKPFRCQHQKSSYCSCKICSSLWLLEHMSDTSVMQIELFVRPNNRSLINNQTPNYTCTGNGCRIRISFSSMNITSWRSCSPVSSDWNHRIPSNHKSFDHGHVCTPR